ncbi:hypothetical protein [Catenuloplanes japonicus]|uniref:hypothetical protein n=1 Tax=Catenuloplanes japonicus TaxID=33876 RepID=UPI00052466E1|nr:hypothetical protein [Catenuloplanes japonicus]
MTRDLPGTDIETAYRDGVSITRLARDYGVNAVTIRRRLTARGVPIRTSAEAVALASLGRPPRPPEPPKPKRASAGRPLLHDLPDEEIEAAYRQGASLTALAVNYRVSYDTIRVRLERRGVPLRKKGEATTLANQERTLPGGIRPHRPAEVLPQQRQQSVRFPESDWAGIVAESHRRGHVDSTGKPIVPDDSGAGA